MEQQKPLWLRLPASLLAGAAAPVVKVPLTCTKLAAGPEARYPASTGNPEHARITAAGAGGRQVIKERSKRRRRRCQVLASRAALVGPA